MQPSPPTSKLMLISGGCGDTAPIDAAVFGGAGTGGIGVLPPPFAAAVGRGSFGGFGLLRGFDPFRFGFPPGSLLFARFVDIFHRTQVGGGVDVSRIRLALTRATQRRRLCEERKWGPMTGDDAVVVPEIQQHATSLYHYHQHRRHNHSQCYFSPMTTCRQIHIHARNEMKGFSSPFIQ